MRPIRGTMLRQVIRSAAFVCAWIFVMCGGSDSSAAEPWTRAPGPHPTNLTAEATLHRVADLLEANNIDEMLKSFLPNNRNSQFFRERQLTDQSRSRLAAFFRGATLVKSGWWEEAHGEVFDEYRQFIGVLHSAKGNRIESKIHMLKVNECSETVFLNIHDPGEWIIFDWLEEILDPYTSRDADVRTELPKGYRCPLSEATPGTEPTK